ncbi:MAG TPA: regulatory signaling modulator protein AmpE [Gammaproteobacteria bacterium]|jgi:membrane protein required for beta-lactamase induction|nr:regulatory signaling modulator protein AmpE [Gammaproteobacteria bacterium]
MIFIATLTTLLIERFFDWSHLRHWKWYTKLQQTLAAKLYGHTTLVLVISVVIPLIIIGTIQLLLKNWLYGIASLVFQFAVLFYCIGPRNFWADTFASINALQQADPEQAAQQLHTAFAIQELGDTEQAHRQLTNHVFIEANRRLFAVIFWFAILGPLGAVLYRTVSLTAVNTQEPLADLAQRARTVEAALDWLPIRVLTFLFALTGHFVHVLSSWRKKVLFTWDANNLLLAGCGMAALHNEKHGHVAEDGSTERAAVSLVDRTLVVWLIIVAAVNLVLL